MLEAGTQGTQGSASVFIPHVTEGYSALAIASEDISYPVCTVRHFPTKVEHTLQVGSTQRTLYPLLSSRLQTCSPPDTLWFSPPQQWAQDEFEGLFHLSAETINRHQR